LPWWLAREITLCGAGDYLAITTSFDLFKLKFLPEMRSVFENTLRIGRWWAGNRVIEIADPQGRFLANNADDPMWGRIILRSVQGKGGLESATAKGAVFDEAGQDDASLEDWEAIIRRLSLAQGRCLIGTTLYNLGWLKSELYDPWQRGEADDVDIIQFASTLNPLFPQKEFERAQGRMQDWRFKMFYLGEYSIPPSLIYGSWTLEDPVEIHRTWPIVVGVDPSGGHCATVWVAQDRSTGLWRIFDETFVVGATTAQNARDALRKASRFQDVSFVGGGPSEAQERRDWQDHGVDLTAPVITSVEAGIDRTSSLLTTGGMVVSRECRGLRDELGRYRRKVDEEGNVLPQILDKHNFHYLDALRAAAIGITEGIGGQAEYGPSPTAGYRG
jgi:hypothetical protein